MKKLSVLLLSTAMFCSSCMTTHTTVGSFKEDQGREYVYDSGKQMWLFWGLVPIGRTNVSTPADGNCEVITKFRFTDALISGLTGGFVTSYTIKVKDKK